MAFGESCGNGKPINWRHGDPLTGVQKSWQAAGEWVLIWFQHLKKKNDENMWDCISSKPRGGCQSLLATQSPACPPVLGRPTNKIPVKTDEDEFHRWWIICLYCKKWHVDPDTRETKSSSDHLLLVSVEMGCMLMLNTKPVRNLIFRNFNWKTVSKRERAPIKVVSQEVVGGLSSDQVSVMSGPGPRGSPWCNYTGEVRARYVYNIYYGIRY